MNGEQIIGIDLGGTNMRAGVVQGSAILESVSRKTNSNGSVEEVLQDIFEIIEKLLKKDIKAIGIGVPSVVDLNTGVVYDVQNIPSWKEVPLQKILQERYNLPVLVNNDANCFALAEYYYGKGKDRSSVIGITLGTGLGAGIIINKKLYAGSNCGAGEFGMVAYLDKFVEYYASGSFFKNVYHLNGLDVYNKAKAGDPGAIRMYEELGVHLGNAIKIIMYTYDPEMIIVGGSLKEAWPFYEKTMWQEIRTFAYSRSVERLKIELSDLQDPGIMGAAALYFDSY